MTDIKRIEEYNTWLSLVEEEEGLFFSCEAGEVVVPLQEFFNKSLVDLTPNMAKRYSGYFKGFSRDLRRFSEESSVDPNKTRFDEFQEELAVLLDEYNVYIKTDIQYYEISTIFSDNVSGQCFEIDKDGNLL